MNKQFYSRIFQRIKGAEGRLSLATLCENPPIIAIGVLLSLLVIVGGGLYWFSTPGTLSQKNFLLTSDQKGQRLYGQARYTDAAQHFIDSKWRAAALYRDGKFKDAATIYAGIQGANAHYNYGNTLMMQGKYEEALDQYDRALLLQPDLSQAVTNREIAAIRAERTKQEGADMTGGMMEADEIVFTKNQPNSDNSEEVRESSSQNGEELRAIWLRQVETKPADFLKTKFAYQLHIKNEKP